MKTILEERSCFTLNEIQLSTGANQHQVSCLKLKQKLLDELAECDLFAPQEQHNKAEAGPDQVPPSIESDLNEGQQHQHQQQQQDANQAELLSKEKEEQQKLEKKDYLIEDQKEVAESGAREPVRGEMEIIENQAPSERIARQESQHCERLNATTTTTIHQDQKHQCPFQHQLQAQTKSTGLYQAPTTPAASQPKTLLISSSQNQRHDNHNHQHLINHSNQHHHHQDHHQRHHHYRQHSQPLPPTPPSSPVLLQAPQAPPKIYPNNTLVEDLTRCHDNLLPKITRATARTIELFRSCLPNKLSSGTGCIGSSTSSLNNGICGKRAKKLKDELAGKQQNSITSAGYINNSIVLTQDDDDSDQSNCDNSPAQARLGPAKVVQAQAGPARARRRTRRAGREKKFQMPDSIVKLNSSLNQDDYNRALSILTNDVRYQLHLLLYRRLQTIWTLFTTILCILIPILCLAHLETFVILGACLLWLSLQATGALVTQQFCKKLDQMLEKAVAQVNSYFMDHNLMLGVINVGGMLTKARLVIPLLYFDTIQCREQIKSIISVDLRKESDAGDKEQQQQQLEQRQTTKGQNVKRERKFALDYSKIGLRKIGPENQMSFAQSQLAKKIILRYSQRWISYFDKRKLMFNDDQVEPRHLSTGKCLCQFIEEHFKYDELDLDEAGGDSANNTVDCAQQQEQQQEQHSEALAKVVVAGEQEAERDCGADVEQQSKELAALRTRSRLVNTPNGNPIRQLDSQLHAALNLVTSTESRKITPLGALSLQQNSHANNLASSSQLDMLVPTLSHLVDMKERQEQFKISMDIGFAQESTAQQEQANNSNPSYPSKLIHGFTTHLQQERLDSNSPPTTEHSFDLNTDAGELLLTSSNCNNDELLKRLKSLLESRKNEFSRGLVDGNHLATNITSQYNNSSNSSTSNCVSTYAGRLPQMTSANGNKSIRTQDSNSGSTQTVNQSDEANSGGGSSRISRLGKKFFSQADGIFFLGAKKSQQGVYAKQQQVLEIC